MVLAGTSQILDAHWGVLGVSVLDKPLTIGAFVNPDISDSFRHGGIGPGSGSYPLIRHNGTGRITVGIDINRFYSQFFYPLTPDGVILPVVTYAAGSIRIDRPHDNLFGVLQGIRQKVEIVAMSQFPVVTPGMHGTPVPALPAVRIVP